MTLTAVAAPSVVALSLLAAGCGGKKIKGSEAEKVIKASGTAYKSVSCPKEIDAKKGYTFTCDADTTQGPFVITIKIDSIENDQARMTIVKATKKKA